MKKAINSICIIISITLLIVGSSLLTIQPISNKLYTNKNNNAAKDFIEEFFSSEPAKRNTHVVISESQPTSPLLSTHKIELKKLTQDIIQYNKTLSQSVQSDLGDKKFYSKPALVLKNYGFDNEVYGYIEIEKIGIIMPIYLGANNNNMGLGAAHMSGSSIPFGGENTNSVLAGHCGYGIYDYFRHIEDLTNDDIIKIITPFKIIHYRVIKKKVIEPNDIEPLKIQNGKDIISLITCHPYPTSKYRLCVYGEAVPPRDNERE